MKNFTVIASFLAVGAVLLFVNARQSEWDPAATGYEVGDEAMDFELKNINGEYVSLSDYSSAKGFIVVFTCNHCPYAKLYEERIIELDGMYADKGYPVIAINPNDPKKVEEDSYENMQSRAEEKGYTFPYLVDGTQEVASAYGATKTPHVYLLQKESGKMMVKYIGAIDNNHKDAAAVTETYVQDAVDALIEGDDVSVTETRAIGCTIKWKDA
ncbi:MAG TPA: thioredoxin family protein [Cytophagales bacterium]|nr:thioredoxin family protein [Cytophagales bacterium]HAA23844.1 thioredoxin family protein [Cytophagales bacterium]HAP58407.1 thioredoxin family protein [Cytophagales bacterium]